MKTLKESLPDILYCWLVLALAVPNIMLAFSEKMPMPVAFANILLPVGVISILISVSPKIGRSVWFFFPMMVLAAFQIVLLALYGRSVIAVDMFLNCVTTNSTEIGELLGCLLPAIGFVCVIYLPVMILSIYVMRKRLTLSPIFLRVSRGGGVLCAIIGFMALMSSYNISDAFAMHRDIYPINAGYNIYLAIDRTVKTSKYNETVKDYKYNAVSTHKPDTREVCVLVIGETSRAANWQLNGYPRRTNPQLSQIRNEIFYAPNAYSESNTTHKAVPMLLCPLNSEDFGEKIYSVKSLVTAFKEAGWSTAFLSAQAHNRSFIDFFSEEADTCVYLPQGSADADLVPLSAKILKQNNKKQLIVLHTYGSHFNYRDRYHERQAHFMPDDYSEASVKNREKLVNAYDNSILATDEFLSMLIHTIDRQDCVASMLYCSDHGEDIYEDGRRFLHASPRPSINQVHVPMLAWLSTEYREAYPTVAKILSRNINNIISSSRSFCPTAFGLAGISTDKVKEESALTSLSYKARTPLYLDDHNHPVTLASIL